MDIPDSNPWKADFTQEFEATDNPFIRKVLADGLVADAEWAEMQSRYSKCLSDLGLKTTPEGFGGAERIEATDGKEHKNFDAEVDGCSDSSGWAIIGPLYSHMRSNPDNEDPLGLLLQCLKDRGVVEKGVKLDQFKEKYEDWEYMDSLGKDHDECAADPKGLLQ